MYTNGVNPMILFYIHYSVLLEVSGLVVLFVALLLDHLGDDRLALSKMCSFVSLFLFFCSMTV